MRLPEYRSKELFQKYGIRTPKGIVITREQYESGEVGGRDLMESGVVKAQNMIGGRGKAGGIKLSNSRAELEANIKSLFDNGFSGNVVDELLIEEKISIDKETYVSIAIDRRAGAFALMASGKGGVEIESMDPSNMRVSRISNLIGLQKFQTNYAAGPIAEAGARADEIRDIIAKLYRLLVAENALLVEINPLAILSDGSLIAADAKIILDDNARAPEEKATSAKGQTPLEKAGAALGVNMVKLDGEIAMISNGAGEGMTSLDQIAQAGGALSLWIDLGGGALSAKPEVLDDFIEKVMDTRPKVLLFTAFFQIGKCDLFAESFRKIYKKREAGKAYIPQIILRLDGRNADEAKKCAEGTNMLILDSSLDACLAAVKLSKEGN